MDLVDSFLRIGLLVDRNDSIGRRSNSGISLSGTGSLYGAGVELVCPFSQNVCRGLSDAGHGLRRFGNQHQAAEESGMETAVRGCIGGTLRGMCQRIAEQVVYRVDSAIGSTRIS